MIDTDASVGIKLMAAAGKPLEEWQQESLQLMMSIRDDGKWACYEYCEWVARQNGKGGLGEARVLAGFFFLGEELIIWSAHEYKTALEAFRRMRTLIRALGKPVSETLVEFDDFVVKISNTNGEEGFERMDTEQRIRFVARSKGSGRGFSGDLNVIDEAFAYTAEQQDALMPTLIARPNAQIVYLSSPPLSGDTGEVMFSLKKRAEAGGDDSLGYRDWGIAGFLDDREKMDLDDTNLWAQANPALGNGRVTLETIARMRKSMIAKGALGFAREVLGLWPREIVSDGGDIDMVLWGSLAVKRDDNGLPIDGQDREGDLSFGVDISPRRDKAAIAAYGHTGDGHGHVKIVDYRPGTDWLIPRIAELKAAKNPVTIAMGRGCGESLKVELKKRGIEVSEDRDEPQRGDLAIANTSEMSAATGQIIDAVDQKTLLHNNDDSLNDSVTGAQLRYSGQSVVWALKESESDTCPLVAATMARWGHESRAHLIDNNEPFHVW